VAVGKKQLIRLVHLAAYLKENRYPNCRTFSEYLRLSDIDRNRSLSCTEKTIYRDIQVLKKDFDAPIAFDYERNGYYLIHHGWNFCCPQIFDDTELLAAVLGARIAEHIFPEPLKSRIRDSVASLLIDNNPDFLDKTQVDSLVIIPSLRTLIKAEVFMPLFTAWQNHETVRMKYEDVESEVSERDFEPHAMIFFDGIWYAKGFCYLRNAPRTFVVHRIKSVSSTGKFFKPDPAIIKSASEELIFDPEIVKNVKIVCDAYLLNMLRVKPLHAKQKARKLTDGRFEVSIPEIARYRLLTWVMRQCGRAMIVNPSDMASEIREFAKKIQKKHGF